MDDTFEAMVKGEELAPMPGADKLTEMKKETKMKWDDKHAKAKYILDTFLCNAEYWDESESLSAGLTEDEKKQVNDELNLMIASIRKRYKIGDGYDAKPETKAEAKVEEPKAKEEQKTEEPKEEKPAAKPKRTRAKRTKKTEVA